MIRSLFCVSFFYFLCSCELLVLKYPSTEGGRYTLNVIDLESGKYSSINDIDIAKGREALVYGLVYNDVTDKYLSVWTDIAGKTNGYDIFDSNLKLEHSQELKMQTVLALVSSPTDGTGYFLSHSVQGNDIYFNQTYITGVDLTTGEVLGQVTVKSPVRGVVNSAFAYVNNPADKSFGFAFEVYGEDNSASLCFQTFSKDASLKIASVTQKTPTVDWHSLFTIPSSGAPSFLGLTPSTVFSVSVSQNQWFVEDVVQFCKRSVGVVPLSAFDGEHIFILDDCGANGGEYGVVIFDVKSRKASQKSGIEGLEDVISVLTKQK